MDQSRSRLTPAATRLALALTAMVSATAACTIDPLGVDIDGQDVRAVFLHTSDIHSRLIPYNMDVGETDKNLGLLQANAPFGGIARLAGVVKQTRRDNDRMAYIDTGDVFQGAPIFNAFGGEPEFLAMTQLGVDAFAIGNHELDRGAVALVGKAVQFANFPMLACNYALADFRKSGIRPDSRIALPYIILNLKGLRVGIIGLASLGGFSGGATSGLVPLRTKEVLQQYVDFLRPVVDLVAVASHVGYHDDVEVIPRTEGIDLYLGGHLHIVLKPPSVVQDCDVAKLKRERDRYRCDTSEKLKAAGLACEARTKCDDKKGAEKTACQKSCEQEAKTACQREAEVRRYAERLKELDADIRFLEQRGCHPRDVLLVHSGAFLKYVGKLEVTLRQCMLLSEKQVCAERSASGACVRKVARRCTGDKTTDNDWEVIAHRYELIPVDKNLPEDLQMLQLMEPYILELNRQQLLTQVLGFTPVVVKRFSAGSGDSALGNMVTEAMMLRNQVWADFAVTNALGMRSDLVAGPVDSEQMNNVFPFDNSITVMYLSGYEVQEMMDFVAQRSATRGCQPQAQIAGITATLNCGGCTGNGGNVCMARSYDGEPCAQKVTVGGSGRPCSTDADCATDPATGKTTGEICSGQSHPDPKQSGKKRCWLPIGTEGMEKKNCSRSFRLATNDYIAHGGSGFSVLGRNTTQKNLYISLRSAAMDYITNMPACSRIPQSYADKLQGRPPVYVVSEKDRQSLKSMEDLALTGRVKEADATYSQLVASLKSQLAAVGSDTYKKAGLTNFLRCIDEKPDSNNVCLGLACRQIVECTTFKAKDKSKCEALGRIRAALRCMTLPCINSREDGRIQRIFKDSSGSPNPYDPWPD